MKKLLLKLFAAVAVLGMMTISQIAFTQEFAGGNVCQTDNDASVTYNWNNVSADTAAYLVCPVQVNRTVSTLSGNAYVYNPGGTVGGYMNFVQFNGLATAYSYRSTTTTGNIGIGGFSLTAPSTTNGYVTFDLSVPAGGAIYGFYTY